MKRLALMAAAVVLVMAAPAQAAQDHWQRQLTVPEARTALRAYGQRDVQRGYSSAFNIRRCVRWSPTRVVCKVWWYDVVAATDLTNGQPIYWDNPLTSHIWLHRHGEKIAIAERL